MLQDMDYGRLENEFYDYLISNDDYIFCFNDGKLLLHRSIEDELSLPTWKDVSSWRRQNWTSWSQVENRYIFRIHDRNYYLWMGQAGDSDNSAFCYESVRSLRQLQSKIVCYATMTAWHLYVWYQNNRFCGRCGSLTVHDSVERMVRCPSCGNLIFPRISPAVIVAVTDGDRLLLTKYAGRGYTRYALIAGYTEIGETLEQTVQREVMEEVGLKVKNIRYYKSQPWGVDGNILSGFYCDLDGDDTIHLDRQELSLAQWHFRDALPAHDDGISLTREMIRVFEEGKEPKWLGCR